MKSNTFMLATLASVLFVGCSKKGSGTTAANGTYISGYAATGAAIAGGQVDLVDAEGNQATSATTDSDGSYRISVGGKTLPYILKVTSSTGKEYMSAVTDESKLNSQINISPLTHTVVARMIGETDPTEAFKKVKLSDGDSSKIDLSTKVTTTALSTQTQAINTALANVIAQVDSANTSHNYDFFNGTFTPGSGEKMDALLDAIKIDSSDTTKIVIKLKADETKTIDVPKNSATSIGAAIPESAVTNVSAQVAALSEIKARMTSFGDTAKNACLNYSTGSISTLDGYFDSSYLNDGETKSKFYQYLWEEECEWDSSFIMPIKFTNVNIDKYDSAANTAEISYDVIYDGQLAEKGEKNKLKKVSGVWKLYGNQFDFYINIMPRVNVNSSYSFNGQNVGSAADDIIETGLNFYLEAADCTSLNAHPLTLSYGSSTYNLKCTDVLGGVQLYQKDKLYTDGTLFSDTQSSDYVLNYKANSIDIDFNTLGIETEMTLSWNGKTKTVTVHKPDPAKKLDFSKTSAQLCSGTSTPSYGFLTPAGAEVKGSFISYGYKTSSSAATQYDGNMSPDNGNEVTVGALPKSSVPSGAQYTWKNFMISAYDEFNRSYTKMLNCSGYSYDSSVVSSSSSTTYTFSGLNHTYGVGNIDLTGFAVSNSNSNVYVKSASGCSTQITLSADNVGELKILNSGCPGLSINSTATLTVNSNSINISNGTLDLIDYEGTYLKD